MKLMLILVYFSGRFTPSGNTTDHKIHKLLTFILARNNWMQLVFVKIAASGGGGIARRREKAREPENEISQQPQGAGIRRRPVVLGFRESI